MSHALLTYLKSTAATGAVATILHGHVQRERRMGSVPFPVTCVAWFRDGLLGAVVGPLVAPVLFPFLAAQTAHKIPCPMTRPPGGPLRRD